MKNKEGAGILGEFITTFIATIIIIAILIIFVMVSGIVKLFAGNMIDSEGNSIKEEFSLNNYKFYNINLARAYDLKFLINSGKSLEESENEINFDFFKK